MTLYMTLSYTIYHILGISAASNLRNSHRRFCSVRKSCPLVLEGRGFWTSLPQVSSDVQGPQLLMPEGSKRYSNSDSNLTTTEQ